MYQRRSGRHQIYDSGESRRSPRSRSRTPPRYNDRFADEYRDRGSTRGGERRRSISDARPGPPFSSGRDAARESVGRGSRDFPPREPPRGPKALTKDPPSGPRASNYVGDFRGDFGYRGEFRGGRGGRNRGRGGGVWRDDSRDRGREAERDYRGSRDDINRAPVPFRDDRSRDRDRWDRNDSFSRGRRPSSPQGRGRSPNYGNRESRDAPSTLDLDRARRGSRDGPLSAGSPASDSVQSFRGYGRGRGARGGRGRGGYYDDYHNRNPSPPDSSWSRRTQPSATPPPQVPAFGSTASNLTAPPAAPKSHAVPTQGPPTGPALGTIGGVPVPTAPRSQRQEQRLDHKYGRGHPGNLVNPGKMPSSVSWINPDAVSKEASKTQPRIKSPSMAPSLSPTSASTPQSTLKETGPENRASPDELADAKPGNHGMLKRPLSKRRPIIGKRAPQIITQQSPQVQDNTFGDTGSDSGDSIGRGDFFEEDMKKIEDQISRLPKNPDDDPLDFPKMAAMSGIPIPPENDTEQRKIWEAELQFHKDLLRKDYNQKLLNLSPLRPTSEFNAPYLEPFLKSKIDHQLMVRHSAMLQSGEGSALATECIANVPKAPEPPPKASVDPSASKPESKGIHRPVSSLSGSGNDLRRAVNGQNGVPHLDTSNLDR